MAQKDQNVNEFNKFLSNNEDFLSEKFAEHFNGKAITFKDFKSEPALKFIYDVFSFSKYESDEKMNNTLRKSLTNNISDFLKKSQKKDNKSKKNNEK